MWSPIILCLEHSCINRFPFLKQRTPTSVFKRALHFSFLRTSTSDISNTCCSSQRQTRLICKQNFLVRKSIRTCLASPVRLLSIFKWRKKNASSKYAPAIPQEHDGKSAITRYIYVKTLVDFYGDIPEGIIMDTAYADSRPNEDIESSVPVVVALHDTPGCHEDLVPMLNIFAKLGCRTIAPTLPGHGNTNGLMRGFDDVFSQSTIERATFVNDFLQDLGVDKVDLLIGVGASCYTALRLITGPDISHVYKSVGLVSPWPLLHPRYKINPKLLSQIQSLWDRPFFRPLARFLLPRLDFGGESSTRDKLTGAYFLNNLDIGEVNGIALAVGTMELPRLVVYAGQDELVPKETYEDVMDKLEIPASAITEFDGRLEGKDDPYLLISPDSSHVPGALVLPSSSYQDVQQRHLGIVCAYLLTLIQRSHPHIKL